MPSTNPQDPGHPSTPPQSIPLRDLQRPPDSADLGDGGGRHTRGRSLLSGSSRPPSGHGYGPRYERLSDGSPSPTTRATQRAGRAGPSQLNTSISGGEEITISPVDNPADFQSAMGFAGLNVPDVSLSHPPPSRSLSYGSPDFDGSSPYMAPYMEETHSYFPPESDTEPLTNPDHLQPISGAAASTPEGQRHDRVSFQSVRFNTPESRPRGSRLGDDLGNAEAGYWPDSRRSRSQSYGASLGPDGRTRSRSPSTVGALSRAGSMMRAMSQRVVNLSGEAELIEQSARLEASNDESRIPPRASMNRMNQDTAYRPDSWPVPFEKEPPTFNTSEPPSASWQKTPPNPLKGKSFGIFSPENRFRKWLCDILVYPATEPFILVLIVLQTVLLAVDASKDVFTNPRPPQWGATPTDYAILGLFVIFTLEILARMIVSGFILNPAEYSTIDRQRGLKGAVADKYRKIFAPQRQQSLRQPRISSHGAPTVLRSFTAMQGPEVTTVEQAQRQQLARRAFLRHSFNRLDFVAVIAFWAAFILGILGVENGDHLFVFRMLSCLRILRLLALTNGTAIILRSLKKAAPLLVNVSFLIGFFWLLFAIVGVQSFKSSLSRQCVWIDPSDPTNLTAAYVNSGQFCGGQLNNVTGAKDPWVTGDLDGHLTNGTTTHKGFLCPRGSLCLELPPSYQLDNGTVNFNNILQSLELVFVIMSGNTFSDLMYYTTDSDYLAAAIFFAAGIIVMMLWLMNLLIAVITSSFQVIREEGKASAFAANVKDLPPVQEAVQQNRVSAMKRFYDKTYWFWIIVIAFDLLAQAFRSASMSHSRANFISTTEIIVTFILLFEIIFRFAVDWRGFNKKMTNWFDLALAVITTIILLPPIQSSGMAYAYLTAFQILRVYRIVMAVSITRMLIMLVLGNAKGIGNLVLFVFLMTFLMSIFAVQLFRGEIPYADDGGETIQTTFFTIYNAFLGMYQVLSSENWTEIMYNITSFDNARNTGWIGAVFFIGWFIFGNFILVNMFIAVIQENFDVSEDEKRMQQVKSFLHRRELGGSSSSLSLSAIFRLGRSGAKKDPLDYGPATMEMLLKDAVVRDFLDEESSRPMPEARTTVEEAEPPKVRKGFFASTRGKFMDRIWHREPNPFYSYGQAFSRTDDNTDARTLAKEAVSATTQRKRLQREFLARHPNYNNSLFLFKPHNPLRRLCQKIVGPGRGSERFDGINPNRAVWYTFSAFIYAAIVAMVLLACVTTPLYQKNYLHRYESANWFLWADAGFAVLFTVEALIKVIADGFFWTPNAYFRSSWGFIDGIVLITLWINVTTAFTNDGAISRAVGAFKALRALRLLNVSDSAKETFHSVILVGGFKVLSAAFVSLSLLIPFAIFGVNLFNGKMQQCNDGGASITNLTDCFGEYANTPFNDDWPLLSPRSVSNPYYDFDNFGGALFILFQIVSQEGWVDVMWSAQSITGPGLQPQDFASQGNAIFFVIFNLLATVFVLTLFISVFMRNYTEQTGVAFLTSDQRSWLELRKLLRQVSPSKRPSTRQNAKFKDWCYKRATRKHGKWHRSMTIILVLHLILLLLEYNPQPLAWDRSRDFIFLAFTFFYITNIFVRINGLSWARFSRSSWDLFSIFAVSGTFATTILLLTNFHSQTYIQLHKLFLVSIVLLLIPRNDALDQLFKTAAASLTSIVNLLATWFVLFLVYAIALTQTFGLTRFGESESDNANFRTVPKALILLFRMSCGEGWNQVMEDFATIEPPLCNASNTFFESDCGSANWARALFISWNILSMYIFTSLFVSLIYESFSYVYQHSSGLGRISREDLRRFKQAWATLDPDGTGFISKEAFPRLLSELSGVFEMRIYSHEDSIRSILDDVQTQRSGGRVASIVSSSAATGVDLKALNARLAKIDSRAVQRSRARYNMFFQEVMVSADPDRGISFTTVMMILAHYNVISDNKSLRLEEFLRRRARLQRVEEEVRRRIVVGFFDTMYWSRRFRKHVEQKKSGRMTTIPQLGPEVYIDDEGDLGRKKASQALAPLSPTDMENSRSSFITYGLDGAPGRQRRETEASINVGPFSPGAAGFSPQLSPNRPTASGFGLEGGDSGPNSAVSSRRGSAVSAEHVLDVLDNSAWGESIRRSFTMRRPTREH